MSLGDVLTFFHFLSVFLFVAGLAAVMSPLLRAWRTADVHLQLAAFEEAHSNEGAILLPGIILTGATGLLLAAERDYDLLGTGWLVALEGVYLFVLLFCLPVLSLGLRRAHLFSLQAVRDGQITPELEEVLADKVPLVFGALIALLMVAMAYLAVFRPF